MFYAATELDDKKAGPSWKKISNKAINQTIKHLKPTEDETVRFYATKTIENITSLNSGFMFATLDVATSLLNAFYTT
jgi:hypothetical protein